MMYNSLSRSSASLWNGPPWLNKDYLLSRSCYLHKGQQTSIIQQKQRFCLSVPFNCERHIICHSIHGYSEEKIWLMAIQRFVV